MVLDFGLNEQTVYDMTRAHSADVFFIKLRAWTWGVIFSVVSLLFGNILGDYGISILGGLYNWITGWF